MPDNKEKAAVFTEPKKVYGKKIQSEPVPEKQIGIDTQNAFFDDVINSSVNNVLDISAFTNFDQASQSRDQVYALIDTMCQDSTISSVLEAYTEDSVERNDMGQIVWADSSDPDIGKYINYLLDAMRVDKNIYKWVHSLCKYGDLYLRIYRGSEYDDGLFDKPNTKKNSKLNEDVDLSDPDIDRPQEKLEEAVNIKAYAKDDHFVQYLEMQPNPAQVFELTKFGKTYAYIKTHINSTSTATNNSAWDTTNSSILGYKYNFNRGDIDVYAATEFVHGCLEDDQSRTPEEVSISLDQNRQVDYNVRRGQSLFYNSFKVWRELLLLKNSVLLNRVTRSSLVRAIQVEIGDMPKEQVQPHLMGIKRLFEQSQSLVAGGGMGEYTNPGPIENNVYIPTRDGKGAISLQQVGGDVNVGQLTDLDYYTKVLFGSLGVPKEYFGHNDDNAGFSGGESLAQISSRYAKKIKRIQDTVIQTLTDAINILLLDRDLGNYINKFTIKMQTPTTSEEVARRETMANRVQLTRDLMDVLGDIEDPAAKLKILKALLSEYINNTEVIELLQGEINKLEAAEEEEETPAEGESNSEDSLDDLFTDESEGSDSSSSGDINDVLGAESTEDADSEDESSSTLPAPNQLGIDFTDSDNF